MIIILILPLTLEEIFSRWTNDIHRYIIYDRYKACSKATSRSSYDDAKIARCLVFVRSDLAMILEHPLLIDVGLY